MQRNSFRADGEPGAGAQLQSSDSGSSLPSTPLRLLRRSGSSQGSGGSLKQGGGTGPRTLMFFKGCPRPLGCTVLLHGADAEQLTLLKRVTKVHFWSLTWSVYFQPFTWSVAACRILVDVLMPLLLHVHDFADQQMYPLLRIVNLLSSLGHNVCAHATEMPEYFSS